LQFSNIKGASRILDVGCGIGSLSIALRDAYPNISITGLDYSQAFVDYARSRAGNGNLHFERGDAAALHYGDAQFDHPATERARQQGTQTST
jgi:ubiquinone/menaquinone biosynthesis C-methylase UbiE